MLARRPSVVARRLPRTHKSPLPFEAHMELLEPRVLLASIDPAFGYHYGPATEGVRGIGAGADGSIYMLAQAHGYGDFGVSKFKPDGTLDGTFGGDGFANLSPDRSTVWGYFDVDSQGRSYAVMQRWNTDDTNRNYAIIYRLTPTGELDTTFSGDGMLRVLLTPGRELAMVRSIQVLSDGDVIVAGDVDSYSIDGKWGNRAALFERYNADGTLDSAFGTAGQVLLTNRPESQLQGITVDSQGRIIFSGIDSVPDPTTLSGYRGVSFMGRLSPNGQLDTGFADNGYATHYGSRIRTDTLGRLYVYGGEAFINPPEEWTPRLGITRLTADGRLDPTWGTNGYAALIDLPLYAAMDDFVVTPEGGVIGVSGRASTWNGTDAQGNLIALNASGQFDERVAPNGKLRFIPPGTIEAGAWFIHLRDADTAYVVGNVYGGSSYLTKFDLFAEEVPLPLREPVIAVPVSDTGNPAEAGGGFGMDIQETDTPAPLQRLGFFSDDDDLLDRVNQDVLA